MANADMDFSKMSQQFYEQWEKGMTAWWDQVLESPAFLSAMGDNLTQTSRARGAYAKAVDDGLTKMHLPTRGDLVRVARIATLLEEKVLSVEDRLLEIQDQLGRIEKESVTARIDAAETRIELRERLEALERRLAALESSPSDESSRSPGGAGESSRSPGGAGESPRRTGRGAKKEG